MRFSTVPNLVSCALLLVLSVAAAQEADPTCQTGIAKKGACCPSACGVCGGSTCFAMSQALNLRCCPSGILKPSNNVPSCADALPPCIIPEDSLPSEADPTCQTGIAKRGACCPSACGVCGGSTCFAMSKSLNLRCCTKGILEPANNLPSCADALPPCIIPEQISPSPSPSPPSGPSGRSSIFGKWREAPVSSGTLTQRHEACSAMVNGELVLLGGRSVNSPTSIYNAKKQTWRTASGPGRGEQLHHMQCVVANRSIWVVASWKDSYPFEKNNEFVFEYQVATDTWFKHPGMPAERNRGGAAAVRRGNLIFVVAGNQGGHGGHAQSVPWVDAFNWKTKKWVNRKYSDMPDAGRDHVGGALVDKRLCIAGGRDGGSDEFFNNNIATTFCYNFTENAWSQEADMPTPRAGANTARTCDGRMMVAGGEGNGVAYDRVDLFDGTRWKQGRNLVFGRHSSGMAFSRCKKCAHAFIPSGSGGQGGGPELFSTEEWVPQGAPEECARY